MQKRLSEETLQIAEKRELKSKGEKEGYKHLNAEFERIARREKKAFLILYLFAILWDCIQISISFPFSFAFQFSSFFSYL